MAANPGRIFAEYGRRRSAASKDIRIVDGRIAGIGAVDAKPGDTVLDATDCVVTPGLVSAHQHLFQTMLKGVPAGIDMPLEGWLRLVPYTYWHRFDEEALRVASMVGMVELLLSGCTTVADHHYLFADGYDFDPAAILFETADRLGMRMALLRGGTTRSRSFDTPDIVPTPDETLDVMLARVQALVARYHDPAPDARRRVVLAPNTPTWGVGVDELRVLAEAARGMGIGLHSHLSETGTYVDYTLAMYGQRPVHWLAEHGWLGKDVWFAHLVHLDASEIRVLAETGTGMAHCPQSNCRLGSGIAPADLLDRAGGRDPPGAHVYVCGPSRLQNGVAAAAAALGWEPARVHRERFTADVDRDGDPFTVVAQRSGITAEVPAGRSIAQVLAENGVTIPISCEQGVCGTCVTRVLDGTVDHRDLFLTDAEKAANARMTVCCSRAAAGSTIVLDV